MNTEEIIEGYLGNTQVDSIYQGSELVWSKTFVNKYMIGGDFITPKNKIIRLNDDDSIDNTWYNNNNYSNLNKPFYQLMYDNINKKVYAAGSPALDGGLVRFNLDGTKDTSFNIGTGFNYTVHTINIDTINQKIYAGGDFTKYKGSTQNKIVRLNMDGTKDTSFDVGTGFNGIVYALNIDTINNKIYAGGNFTEYKGNTQNRLVRLNMDGSLDTSFNVGTGFGNLAASVQTMIIYNSKIYVGGAFTTFQGSTQNRFVRLNYDGSKDTSFNVGTGFEGAVYALSLDTINQRLYVGGNFTEYKGNTQNRLVRLNMDGSLDTSFNVGDGPTGEYVSRIYDILIDNEKNKIYIAGNFTTYNGQPQKYIARLNMNGSLDTSFNIQLSYEARTILKYTE